MMAGVPPRFGVDSDAGASDITVSRNISLGKTRVSDQTDHFVKPQLYYGEEHTMALFKKTYTSDYFDKLSEKHDYYKLSKLLNHADVSVVKMAEDTLQKLIRIGDENKYRIKLYESFPTRYDKIIKRLENVQSSNQELNLEPIIRVFVQDSEPLRLRKQLEQQEFEQFCNLLKEKGVHSFSKKNVQDLRALLEQDESIECAMHEGSRGNLIVFFSIYKQEYIYSERPCESR